MTLNKWIVSYVLGFLALFYFNVCCAQVKPYLLKDELKEIEARENITFNFATELLEGVYVSTPLEKISLNNLFKAYSEETGISFKFLNDKHIILKKEYSYWIHFQQNNVNSFPIANVKVTDIISNKVWYSNRFGNVFFKLDELPNAVAVSHLNYKAKVLPLREGPIKNQIIDLELLSIHLNEVLLETFLTSGILQGVNGNFVIKPKRISELPGQVSHDIMKGLQNLPNLSSNDESINDLSVNGGTNDQNQLLWNGIKMYQKSHFFGNISAFNYNLVDHVKLIDNATPANLGGSTSSTIKIESQDNLSNSLKAGVGLSLLSADFYTKIPVSKKSNFLISARRGVNDFIKSPTYKNYAQKAFQNSILNSTSVLDTGITKKDKFYFFDIESHYLLNYNKNNKFRIHTLFLQNDLEYSETNSSQNNTKTSTLKQESYAIGGNWNHIFSSKMNAKISYGYSKYNLKATNHTFLFNLSNDQKNKITSSELKLDLKNQLTNKLAINYGSSFEYIEVTNTTSNRLPSFFSLNKALNNTTAIYGELKYNSEKMKFGFGARALNYSKLKKQRLEPRFYATYLLNNKFSMRMRGEQKSQYISQVIDFQNNFLGVEKRRWYLANDSIYPLQTSRQIDLGLNFKKNKHFSIYGSAFLKNVKGINTLNQGFKNQNQFENHFGEYLVNGITLHSNYNKQGKTFWASYTYAINNYRFNGLNPPTFRNNFDIRHRLVSGAKINFKPFTWSVGIEYRTGAPYTTINETMPITSNGISGLINYNSHNLAQLPDYFRLDSSITYNFKINKNYKAKIIFGAINITNKTNTLNRLYKINTADPTQYNEVEISGIQFTTNFSFRVDY